MAATTLTAPAAEFTLPHRYRTDRRTPLRWLLSHVWRYWPLGLMLFIGAASNGALAAVVPIVIGDAFEAILKSPPQTQLLLGFAITIIVSQAIRSFLQFARNFSAEWLGLLLVRNIREEL